MNAHQHIVDAMSILAQLGLPRAQQNERSALCLLALLDLPPGKKWKQAGNPLIGITPIMDWAKAHYASAYAPNTRETFRRQTMHQFVAAGIARYNPDDPERPTNSPYAVYQIKPETWALLKTFGSRAWAKHLADWLAARQTLSQRYAKTRNLERVPVKVSRGKKIDQFVNGYLPAKTERVQGAISVAVRSCCRLVGFTTTASPLRVHWTLGPGLAFCHSATRSHPFNLENAAAIAPPTGAEAGARFGFPPAGLP